MDTGRMRAERLMNDSFHTVTLDDGALRLSLNEFRGYDFFRDHDDAASRLGLFFVLPAGPVDLAVSFAVSHLHVNQRDVGSERLEQNVIFSGERTLHAPDIARSRSAL